MINPPGYIPVHSAHTRPQGTQAPFHPPVLLGMGVPANLGSKPWGLSVVVMTQGNVVVCCKLNRCCRLFSKSLLSLGYAIDLGITVVFTITRSTLEAFIIPMVRAALIETMSRVSTPSSPIRLRQRVRLEESVGASV